MGGQTYCGDCKVLAVKDQPVFLELTPCKEARDALILSIVGICICAIIMEPYALTKAHQAKRMIEMNPQLSGWGQATAAQIIAVIGLILFAVGVLSNFAGGLR